MDCERKGRDSLGVRYLLITRGKKNKHLHEANIAEMVLLGGNSPSILKLTGETINKPESLSLMNAHYRLENSISTEGNLAVRPPRRQQRACPWFHVQGSYHSVCGVLIPDTQHLNLTTRRHQQSPKWEPGSEVLVSVSQVPRSWKTTKAHELDPRES